jgi:hypothetical protein
MDALFCWAELAGYVPPKCKPDSVSIAAIAAALALGLSSPVIERVARSD